MADTLRTRRLHPCRTVSLPTPKETPLHRLPGAAHWPRLAQESKWNTHPVWVCQECGRPRYYGHKDRCAQHAAQQARYVRSMAQAQHQPIPDPTSDWIKVSLGMLGVLSFVLPWLFFQITGSWMLSWSVLWQYALAVLLTAFLLVFAFVHLLCFWRLFQAEPKRPRLFYTVLQLRKAQEPQPLDDEISHGKGL